MKSKTSPSLFIGRKAELGRLSKIFEPDQYGTFGSSVVIIEGEAGIGKTTLVERFKSKCTRFELIWAQCEPGGRSDPWPYILSCLLRSRGVDSDQYSIYQSVLGGVTSEDDRPAERVWEKISDMLFSWANSRPILVVIEDLHHAKGPTIGCLNILTTNLALSEGKQKGLGIILTIHSGQSTSANLWIEKAISKGLAVRIKLGPFKRDEAERYIKSLLPHAVPQDLIDKIRRLSGGNPYFIETLVRDLAKENRLDSPKILNVPTQLRPLLETRLRSLNRSNRDILELMAVIDRVVTPGIIATLLGRDDKAIADKLRLLIEGGLVIRARGRDYFGLKHGLLREVLYQGITESRKELLHRLVVKGLLKISSTRSREQVEEIVTHAILGKDNRVIREYAMQAVKHAQSLFAWDRALDYLKAYLHSLREDQDAEWFEAKLTLARVYSRVDQLEEAIKECEQILERTDRFDTPQRLNVMVTKLILLIRSGRSKEALRYIAFIKESVPDWPGHREGLQLLLQESNAMLMLSRYQEAEALARTGLDRSARYNGYLEVEFKNVLGLALIGMGLPREASLLYQDTIEKVGVSELTLGILMSLGGINLALGNLQLAEQQFRDVINLCKKIGHTYRLRITYNNLARLLVLRSRYQEAFEIIRDIKRWAEAAEDLRLKAGVYLSEGSIHHSIGDLLAARGMYQRVIDLYDKPGTRGEIWYAAMIALGTLRIEMGEYEDAIALFEEANQRIDTAPAGVEVQLLSDIEVADAMIQSQRHKLAEEKIKQIQTRYQNCLDTYRLQHVLWLIVKGRFVATKGELEEGIRYLEQAVSISASSGIPLLWVRGLYELASLYRKAGRLKDANAQLAGAMEILEGILRDLPARFSQTFRASRLFRQVQDSLSGLKIQEPSPSQITLEQELLLTGRMLQMLEELSRTEEVEPCASLLIRHLIELSGANGGLLLIRAQMMGVEVSPLLSLEIDRQRIEFVPVASAGGLGKDQLHSLLEGGLKDALINRRTVYEGEFVYLPLEIRGRLIGAMALKVERSLDQIIQKVLRAFLDQAALILDRLYLVRISRSEYQQRMADALSLKEGLRLRYTELELKFMGLGIIGHSEPMQRVYELVEKVATLNIPVLIQGETGTGKELIARAIHHLSGRRARPFVAISCGAIPETLLDSELFGHVKGAFTGADKDHQGLFEIAHGGTLFLDEIEAMSPGMQVKLLRSIQDYQIRRVGGIHPIHVDVRIIAATNKDIREMTKGGRFRKDLFYRLNVAPINLPPLRDRSQDIPLLVSYILNKIKMDRGLSIRLTPLALKRLQSYEWPGNVRELENTLIQLSILGKHTIEPQDIELEGDLTGPDRFRGKRLRDVQIALIKEALQEQDWDVASAARLLGIPRSTLYRRIRQLGLKRG
jgi:transcriptional regulator with GAF, ATPase, and Fis domain/tetratricopeptide (TPR) repeat protein